MTIKDKLRAVSMPFRVIVGVSIGLFALVVLWFDPVYSCVRDFVNSIFIDVLRGKRKRREACEKKT